MARSNFSEIDEYGFQRPDNFDYNQYEQFMSNYIRVLTRRALRWNSIGKKYSKGRKLNRFVKKGVPKHLRSAVWMSISGAQDLQSQSHFSYSELKKRISDSSINETIKIDLPRTFPENIYFSERKLPKQLFYVLATFAHQNSDVGYCQGLNYIGGLLLLVTENEETSFWLLKTLVEVILPKYSVKNMSGLLTDLNVLDDLVKKSDPEVYEHVHKVGLSWAMVTTKWFICLFVEVLPTETVLRIWDCLFYEGSKIIFRVGLTLIKLHRIKILKAKELGDLIAVFKEMKVHKNVIDCHQFIADIYESFGNITNTELQKLRQKHKNAHQG